MGKPKSSSKKPPKRGIDFKKIKRKIGRKLPPPKNTTNTEIKSKAIILPEQSVASDKAGLAVSKKGLTLKELMQQTSHHNAKVRKDALIGIKDILTKNPDELRLHKLALIEKLRERISDDDKLVRETLYQIFKGVIFPGCKEDGQGPFISLMMVYIFSAMTNLAIDIRLMAFKFLDLILQNCPTSFSSYAEKILQNYEDILRQNQFYLQDKAKLKNALAGITYCLSLLPHNRRGDTLATDSRPGDSVLHSYEPDVPKESAGLSVITKKLNGILPILVGCFHDFVPLVHTSPQLDAQSFDCMLSVLQSIDLIVQFFAYGIDKGQHELQISLSFYTHRNVSHHGQDNIMVMLKKLWDVFPLYPAHQLSEKEDNRYFILNIIISEIFLSLIDWIYPSSDLLEKFLMFIENALSEKICGSLQLGKVFHDKHSVSLVAYIPKLLKQVSGSWRSRILQGFTNVFKSCKPESSLKMVCISAIEEFLDPEKGWLYLETTDPEILAYHITWLRELPSLLIHLGDKHQLSSKAVLLLQLHLGQCALINPSLSQEYNNIQYTLKDFYSKGIADSTGGYGPFVSLTRDIQELSVCCLYYFPFLDSPIIQSVTSCCLCHNLESVILFRIIEILHSSYKAGRIQIANHISFFITLLARYKVYPEKSADLVENDGKSNFGTFKSITNVVCSFLLQLGDEHIVFQMLEKIIIDQLLLNPPLDNICALLRVLVKLDSEPTRLSEQSMINLGSFLPGYLTDIVSCIPEDKTQSATMVSRKRTHYYLLPCMFIFHRSHTLLKLVLKKMGSLVNEESSSGSNQLWTQYLTGYSSRIDAIVSVLLLIFADIKIQQKLLLCKEEIQQISEKILQLQLSEVINMTMEERYKIRCSYDRLKSCSSKLLAGIR
ncbi:hypothetical protein DCAR_0625647 [Daucus carota subsp. sativus]|uniref:Pre-rRNA-processing protein Ipi1 N-terminal domain-containing protein n=1 Tax=Daucus carota subsp. sativus TaxID=79200 RepID=A0AAF0XFU7_DAUCS|nr:PREDICTED: uncharacterized protein LOC108228141 isoform X2 [Daucus carota subsp. sativus]WOH06224.1 hypothetical protein DCAR_0625647 [Daucus carota subsp. sativus]